MSAVLYILLATSIVGVTSVLLGKVLLRWAQIALTSAEEVVLGGVLGSGCVAIVAFALTYVGLGRRGAFTITASVLVGGSLWSLRTRPRREAEAVAPLTTAWAFVFWACYALFGTMYLIAAMAPEVSADGAGYHLGRVSTWLRVFSFRTPEATLPDGMESLFLFASAIGHQSAATMVEWLYLMALPVAMMLYGRRIGYARAGVVAALMVFLSPIVARTGTIASGDVAIACVVFACVWLLELQGDRWRKGALSVGLMLFCLWVAATWFLREVRLPIGERNIFADAWPLEIAVHGSPLFGGLSGGLVGPLFLLAPLALFAMRWSAGRRLMGAAIGLTLLMAIAVPHEHIEARTLIPVLPLVAMSLAMVLSEWRGALPMVAVAAVVMGWPAVTFLYSDDSAWRIPRIDAAGWQAAVRVESEDHYLRKFLRGYHSGRMLEERVAAGDRVLLLSPFSTAYNSLNVLDASSGFGSAQGSELRGIVAQAAEAATNNPESATQVRGAAAQAIKRSGVGWLVIDETDPSAHDMFQHASEWGLTVRWIVEKIEVFKVN